jgi:predicted  nucleic acid-binding Zn-ribbon protein
MRRTWMALFLVLLAAGAAAQGGPAVPNPVAAELARVNATLKEMTALLNRQSDLQSLDLLMKRVQLSESQVAELERQIRTDQSELRGLETERANDELRLSAIGAQLKRNNPEEHPAELEAMSAQATEALKRTRLRIGQLNQEIAGLQADLASRQEDLRGWQALLDRRLSKQVG